MPRQSASPEGPGHLTAPTAEYDAHAAYHSAVLLRRMLRRGMPRPASEVLARGRELGISSSSIKRAKARLGVTTSRLNGVWHWTRP